MKDTNDKNVNTSFTNQPLSNWYYFLAYDEHGNYMVRLTAA